MPDSGAATADGYAFVSADAPASATVIAGLQHISGAVTVTRADLIIAVRIGDPIYRGDVIQTGADGFAAVAFADGSVLHICADGHVALDDAVDGAQDSISTLVRIAKGAF